MHNTEFRISFRNESVPNEHMHQEIEFFYVMEGEICLHVFEKKYHLKNDDFIVINSNHRHSFSAEKSGSVCILHFDTEMVVNNTELNLILFHCNSTIEDDQRYSYIRDLMSQLLSECAVDMDILTLRKRSILYDLLDYLTHYFLVNETGRYFDDQDMRIENMLQYINTHYRDSITLKELSEKFYMTPSSVSRYFKKATGSNYIQYVNQIRMHHTLEDLCYTENSITNIAMANGFSNSSVFCKSFREQYGRTPIEYRKNFHRKDKENNNNIRNRDIVEQLMKYEKRNPVRSSSNYKINLVSVDCDTTQTTGWKNPWSKAFHLGTAFELLSAEARDQISMAKQDIGFTYGHVLSIFSEKMKYRHGHECKISNYIYIDSVLDFLVDQKIRPVISFDNKKEVIMKGIGNYLYESQEEIPFDSIEEMLSVIEDFMQHIVSRYGTDEVSGWIFDCWYHHIRKKFMGIVVENYSDVFVQVYTRIKSFAPGARVGGWGVGITEQSQDSALYEIMRQWALSDIHPDFIGILLYPYAVTKEEDSKLNYRRRINNAEYYTRIVSACRKMMDECNLGDIPVYIDEWNTSMSKRNYYNETCGKAVHLLQLISEMNAEADYAAYKELTDLSGIYEDNMEYLYGGWGMVNAFGARKPVYYALMFLSRTGSLLIYKDKQAIITSDGLGTYTILCFNGKRLKYGYYTKTEDEISADQIEQIFEDDRKLEITFHLDKMEDGDYTVSEYIISPSRGSVLNEWKKLGMKETLDKEDYEYLKNVSIPEKKRGHIQADNNILVFTRILDANEIRLIRLRK